MEDYTSAIVLILNSMIKYILWRMYWFPYLEAFNFQYRFRFVWIFTTYSLIFKKVCYIFNILITVLASIWIQIYMDDEKRSCLNIHQNSKYLHIYAFKIEIIAPKNRWSYIWNQKTHSTNFSTIIKADSLK